MSMTKHLSALLFSMAIIIAAALLGKAYFDRSRPSSIISVTGLGETNFTSDLIVWEGRFQTENADLSAAYAQLEADKALIKTYLENNGVAADAIVFSAVSTRENNRARYSSDGRYIGEDFIGYVLSQQVEIESTEVAQIEKVAREVTELLNQGVKFYSMPPRYYFTALSDLKIELISKATEDARLRSEQIAKNSGAALGKLESAQMGIFQITGQNSDENYTWGGAFNTADKEKTASITMKLTYELE